MMTFNKLINKTKNKSSGIREENRENEAKELQLNKYIE